MTSGLFFRPESPHRGQRRRSGPGGRGRPPQRSGLPRRRRPAVPAAPCAGTCTAHPDGRSRRGSRRRVRDALRRRASTTGRNRPRRSDASASQRRWIPSRARPGCPARSALRTARDLPCPPRLPQVAGRPGSGAGPGLRPRGAV